MPEYNEDVHLIRYDIKMQRGNVDIVHHIVIYECDLDVLESKNYTLYGHECGAILPPKDMQNCLSTGTTVMVWVGTKKFLFLKI